MKLTKRLSDALAGLVGDALPTSNENLLSEGKSSDLYGIASTAFDSDELPGLNRFDLTWILFQACYAANRNAHEKAIEDPAQCTSAALREALLQEVRKRLDPLPRDCYIYVPLISFPNVPGDSSAVIEICRDLSIVMAQADYFFKSPQAWTGEQAPLSAIAFLGNLGRSEAQTIPALRVKCSGYLSGDATCSAAMNGLAKIREFLYLGKSFNALRERPGIIARAMLENSTPDSIFGQSIDGSVQQVRISVKPELLSLAARALPATDSQSLLDDPEVREDDHQEKYRRFVSRTRDIALVLDSAEEDRDFDQIRRAIEWAFEAQIADERSVSLVQSFIALEALLGDEATSKMSADRITERLADRYSYLVGTTQSNRHELREQFRRLYRIRGQVVHGKKIRSKLEHEYEGRFGAEYLASQAIRSEVIRCVDVWRKSLAGALRRTLEIKR